MKVISSVFVLYYILQTASSEHLPPIFKKCSSKDTKCLEEAIEDSLTKISFGLKELDVPSLDPLKISKLTIGAGNIVQLVQNYEKINIVGFSTAKVENLKFDLDEGNISFGVYFDKLEFTSSYVVRGKILVLDVFGKGNCIIRLENVSGSVDMEVRKYEKNDETYLDITKLTLRADPKNVNFQFDNLFDGNKQLGDNINNVLNDNWREIFYELKTEYLNSISRYLMMLSNKLFEKIPLKYIFLD